MESQGPRSVVSVGGTDLVSEDGARYDPAKHETLGSPSFPHERPTSSAQQGTRRGYQHYRSSRAFGGNSNPVTRPTSSSANRLSLTHAPAVAPAFYRPMSSQRLQAQRSSQRTSRNPSRPESPRGYIQSKPTTQEQSRNSLSSYPNTPALPNDDTVSRPETRASDFSEQQDHRDTSGYSPSQNRLDTLGSTADSTRPLHRARAPSVDDLASTYRYSTSKEMRRPVRGSNTMMDRYAAYEQDVLDEKQIAMSHEKNWEHFTGNTVFCWGGRFQNTRDKPISIITAFLIVLPSILFFIFEAPAYWQQISPAVPIIYAYFFYICMSSFIHASVTDAGILPRNLHPFPKADKDEDPLTLGPTRTAWTMVKSFGKSGGAMGAMDVPTKYCKSCNIWRPPRAHHCGVCNNCVETQDHHCAWLNNCVGRRNYRYFFTFVSSSSFLAIFLCFTSLGLPLHYASTKNVTFGQALYGHAYNRVAFAMFWYGLLISIYPTSLTGYHLFLLARGETTREYLNSHKFKQEDRHRPYDTQSWFMNWTLAFCRYRTPTYLRFKDAYIEGDQRFGPKRGNRHAPLSTEQQGGGLEMESIGQPKKGPLLPR